MVTFLFVRRHRHPRLGRLRRWLVLPVASRSLRGYRTSSARRWCRRRSDEHRHQEAFQKAIRSLSNGRHCLGFAKDFNKRSFDDLMALLAYPTSERQFIMYEALRRRGRRAGPLEDPYQGAVHPTDEGVVEREEDILKHKGRLLPDDLYRGQEGRLRRPLSRQAAWRAGGPDSRAEDREAGRGGRFPSGTRSRSRTRPITTPATTCRTSPSILRGKIMVLAAGRTASARASSSTTAASTRPCTTRASSRSW